MNTPATRKRNFYAGPSTLPLPVIEEIRDSIVDFQGNGLSLIESSHRSSMYDEVHGDAESLVRELLGVPDNFYVLFLGGGATLQFAMVPMNLRARGESCDFTVSGAWAKNALDDAAKLGKVTVVFDGADRGYSALPDHVSCDPQAAYLHVTSNETIGGLQWASLPDSGGVPLAVDMSSDIMSKAVPFDNIGVIYAGAQKNLGPAGVTLVIVRKDFVAGVPEDLPAYLSYRVHAEKNSLYNTPPVFSIYALKLVLQHVKKNGGLSWAEEQAEARSKLVYDVIDRSDGFYKGAVSKDFRSKMNVVFSLPSTELETGFLEAAEQEGMLGLKGHRSVGGCRASLYNALPLSWAEELVGLMKEFMRRNG